MLTFMMQNNVPEILVSFITCVPLPQEDATGKCTSGGGSSSNSNKDATTTPPVLRPVEGSEVTEALKLSYRATMLLAGPEPTEALGEFVEARASLIFGQLFEAFSPASSGSITHACHVLVTLIEFDIDKSLDALLEGGGSVDDALDMLRIAAELSPTNAHTQSTLSLNSQ